MHPVDILVFVGFIASVITIGLWQSRSEETHSEHGAQDYFLAGRGLTWWLVGFSLIAANISTEQFVGMSGESANWLGMAIASYEWMAAITLVVVAFVFLPKFLKSGIYTIPEFLEYRYDGLARIIMAISTMIILVGVPTASVIYSGAKVICVYFQGYTPLGIDLSNITVGCWIIGVLAAVYVFAGGLKACAWADLIQGSALILGGAIIAYLALGALGAADPSELITTARNADVTTEQLTDSTPIQRFVALNKGALPDGKLHMKRPINDPKIPWSALVVGLWIPNFFYWGLNQYITQRTLGAKSLAEGQMGVVFAAFLKLLIPFVVVIPGILAYNLYRHDLASQADSKNAAVQDLITKQEQQSVTFTEAYAELHPQEAANVVAHNARLSGAGTSDLSAATAGEIVAANALVIAEIPADIKAGGTLVGYDYDAAFPTLLRNLLANRIGVQGFVLAAIFGAVVSSLASMLNSASTIFAMDIYGKAKSNASQFELVTVGRICTIVFVLIAVLIAPQLDSPKFGGIFTFIQEFQGFISPGILAIFLFGLLVHRAPRVIGMVGLMLNPLLYGLFKFSPLMFGDGNPSLLARIAEWSFLDRMALCFGILLAVLTAITLAVPLKHPVELPVNEKMNVSSSPTAKFFGFVVVLLTVALYVIFW